MNLAVLKTEARAVAQRQQDRLQNAIDEDRELTAEEETADAEDKAKLARLTAQIQRAEGAIAAAVAIGAAPGIGNPPTGPPANGAGATALDNGGFAHLAEFAQAVRCANPAAGQNFRMDDRLAAPGNVHMEQGDAAGSYLVPAEFRQQIVNLVFDDGNDPIMDLIDPDPTSSNRVVGLGDETTPWGNSGIVAAWRSEGEQMLPSRMALTPRETKLNELYAFVLATEELLEDAPRVGTLLTNHAAAAIRWKAADGFMYGDGVEKPLGWMNSPATIAVAKDAAQTAATVSASNIARMWARMIMPSQASWLVNSDVMPTLMDMKDGGGRPLWFGNYQDSPGGVLLGRPVVFNEHSRSVGQFGDIQFVNPNGYEAFRKQNGVSFADSIHLYFDYNIRAFRWVFRIGGQPVLSKPVAPANGGNTKSHFVALAERAYTTKALPPETFSAEDEVERSPESELYFVRLGVAGFMIDGELVDQDYRPIVVQTTTVIEVVSPGDRRFADGGRGGEVLGVDAPQRASTGPGNDAMFGTADPNLRVVQVEQLTSDLAASVQQLDDHRGETSRQIEELTGDLTAAQGAREAALADLSTTQAERDKAASELAETKTKHEALESEHAAAVDKIDQLEQQIAASAGAGSQPGGGTGRPGRGK